MKIEIPKTLEGKCEYCGYVGLLKYVGGYYKPATHERVDFYACKCGQTYTSEKLLKPKDL